RSLDKAEDPNKVSQIEQAIAGLREVTAKLASGDTVAKLFEEVYGLGRKVDQLSASAGGVDLLAAIERRIGALADALQAHNQGNPHGSNFETVVKDMTDRIEAFALARADQATVNRLEEQIAKLVERLDATEPRPKQLESIERGINEL